MRSCVVVTLMCAGLVAGCGDAGSSRPTNTGGRAAPAYPPAGPAARVPAAADRVLVLDARADGRVPLTLGISGLRLVPAKVAFRAGRPLAISLVSLDRRIHQVRLAGRPQIEVHGNVPDRLRQKGLAPGTYRIWLDGNAKAGELRALTAPQMRAAKARDRRLGPPKRPKHPVVPTPSSGG